MEVAAQPRQFPNPQPTSSFAHQRVFSAAANSFQFIALRTLSSNGNSLAFSFQQLPHSLLSHGTGPSFRSRFSNFHFPMSNFSLCFHFLSTVSCQLSTRISLSSFFATLTNSASRKSCICHSYENTGGGTKLFPIWNSLATPPFLQYNPPRSTQGVA